MSDDIISRQAALCSYQEVCNKVECYKCKATDEDGTCKLERWIKELPSAERLGRWETEIRTEYDGKHATYACSVCGNMALDEFAYCPNCGARMEVSE